MIYVCRLEVKVLNGDYDASFLTPASKSSYFSEKKTLKRKGDTIKLLFTCKGTYIAIGDA